MHKFPAWIWAQNRQFLKEKKGLYNFYDSVVSCKKKILEYLRSVFILLLKFLSCIENNCSLCKSLPYALVHRVTEEDNKLGVGNPFLGVQPNALYDVNLYAADKELYLGSKCQVEDTPNPWQFWMIMLKSGNMDTYSAKCPKNGHRVGPFGPDTGFVGNFLMHEQALFRSLSGICLWQWQTDTV